MNKIAQQSLAQITANAVHLHPETTDATTADIDRARETAKIDGENGAGLEIAGIAIRGREEAGVALKIGKGVQAGTAATIDEVSESTSYARVSIRDASVDLLD